MNQLVLANNKQENKMNTEKIKATLRLFNAIELSNNTCSVQTELLERTIKNGYLLDPKINGTSELLDVIEEVVGISNEKANAAFHKSWEIIQDTPQEVLWLQASIHYMTTYGFKALGYYNENTVYIPNENLDVPEISENILLTYIKGIEKLELIEAVAKLVSSDIAFSEQVLKDVMTLVTTKTIDLSKVEISNRELKALCNDFYGIVPSEPVEFLRHLISKLTNESLVIKNDYLINKIKESNGKFLDTLMQQAPKDLASIFYRYKPLFLAMKSISLNKTFFNKLRKDAKTMHKALPIDYLNNVTSMIKNGCLTREEFLKRLETASVFRKTRLLNALSFRLNSPDSIVYKVRNGNGYATSFDWNVNELIVNGCLNDILNSIAYSLDVAGKTFYIPKNVHYTLPATEKQFTGNFPDGSYVVVPEDIIIGIHWTNTNKTVDLDLSVVSASGKTGWDCDYMSKGNDVLFSGDVTSAPKPNGASELFYIKTDLQENQILCLNYFNFETKDEVEMKLFVAQEKPENFGKNYMVDVNNIVASALINITKKQNALGFITNVDGENRFYFSNTSVGREVSSSDTKQMKQTRNFYVNSLKDRIKLEQVLKLAGASVVDEKPENDFVDLSPEVLEKSTIINILLNK